jgi:hypothetical protein
MDDEEAFASTSGALKLKVAVKEKASRKDKKKKKKKNKDKGKKRALESVPVSTDEPLQAVAQPTMTASELKFQVRALVVAARGELTEWGA